MLAHAPSETEKLRNTGTNTRRALCMVGQCLQSSGARGPKGRPGFAARNALKHKLRRYANSRKLRLAEIQNGPRTLRGPLCNRAEKILVAAYRKNSTALIGFVLRNWKRLVEDVACKLLLEISAVQAAVRPQIDKAMRALHKQRVPLLAEDRIDCRSRVRKRSER